jgi:ribose transport system substrate-binding protein
VPAAVQQAVHKYSDPPTISLPPLPSKPLSGKFVIYLANSAVPTDIENGNDFVKEVKPLGWRAKVIDYAGTPASITAAMQQAIADKPDAIASAGQEPANFQSEIPAAEAAKIPIFTSGVTSPPGNGVAAVSDGTPYFQAEGKILADWIIADSGGKAHVAIFTLPAFASVLVQSNASVEEFKAECPNCKTQVVSVQPTDIGTKVPSQVVSTLQADPTINYALFVIGDLTLGVDAALSSAGIQNVKVVTGDAIPETYAALRNKTEAMGLGLSAQVYAADVADAIARYFVTKSSATTNDLAFQIFTPANVPASTPVVPADWASQFAKIWNVSP